MPAILVDDCLYHLYAAQEAMNDYTEVDIFQDIFEAENPEVKAQMEKNATASKTAMDHLRSAIKWLIDFGKKIIDSINNLFQNLTMSKDDRDAYNKFKEACKNDPSLKNKKVTVTDYRKTMGEYQKLLKEVEEADRALAANKEYPLEKLMEKIKNFAGGAGKGVATAVTAEAALRIAGTSQDFAKIISTAVKHDTELLAEMEKNIGKYQTKKFQKDLNMFGKRLSLKRYFLQKTGQLSKSVEGAIQDTFSPSGLFGIATKALGNKEVKNVVKNTGVDVASVAASSLSYNHKVKAEKKRQEKYDAYVNDQMAKGNTSVQSAMDSLLGTNDPKVQARREAKAKAAEEKRQQKEQEKVAKAAARQEKKKIKNPNI